MAQSSLPEVWLRGPLAYIPDLLQPVAHALLQAQEEVNELMKGFPEELLWKKPAGVASAGFHLQHMTGVLDRLFTYAKGLQLSAEQLAWLQSEGQPTETVTVDILLKKFNAQVTQFLAHLRTINEGQLKEKRGVGRAQLPSTVLGLLFHAAEHTMRHLGQLLVTSRIVKEIGN